MYPLFTQYLCCRYDTIMSYKYDGTGMFMAVQNAEWLNHPFAVTLYGHLLIWTDWRTTMIASANKWNGKGATHIEVGFSPPYDVKVFHESRQPMTYTGSDAGIEFE